MQATDDSLSAASVRGRAYILPEPTLNLEASADSKDAEDACSS